MSKILEKYCPGCNTTKASDDFNKSKARPDGLSSWCRDCSKANNKRWRENNKEYKKEYDKTYYKNKYNKSRNSARRIERLYGLSPKEHQKLKDEQNNLCKICLKPETKINSMSGKVQELCVDHCHDTGKVRGLLCHRCNVYIGALGDTEVSIERVYHYMKGELNGS